MKLVRARTGRADWEGFIRVVTGCSHQRPGAAVLEFLGMKRHGGAPKIELDGSRKRICDDFAEFLQSLS